MRYKYGLRFLFLIIVGVFITVNAPTLLCAQDVLPLVIFDKYQEYFEACALTSFSASTISGFQDQPKGRSTRTVKYNIDFTRKRYKLEIPLPPDGQDEWLSFSESVFSEGKNVSVSVYPKREEQLSVTSYVKPPDDFWDRYCRLLSLSYPFGYISVRGVLYFVPDIINVGTKSVKFEDEKPVLTCETSDWKFVIKLLPEKNYVAESIMARQIKPVSDPRLMESFEYVVEHFIEKDGVWFPGQYHIKEVFPEGEYQVNLPPGLYDPRADKNGKIKKKREILIAEVNFSEIAFPKKMSDKDFQITISIPDYTKVSMQDAPQIKHVWLDGKIEPLTDELALARLRGHKFIPGVREPRFWLMASGIILITLGAAGKIWKYYQNKKGGKDA